MMRALFRLNKRGLSNIVAYVLLISITVALSVIVYSWLRFYVSGSDVDECSDNVNIIIRSYECFLPNSEGVGGRIKVTLKNKGLFTVDGFELRVHDREDADFGFYLFDDEGVEISPGEEYTETYYFADYPFDIDGDDSVDDYLETVTLLEVQPFVGDEGGTRCKSYSSQEIICQ
jgi:flagellin-like protein